MKGDDEYVIMPQNDLKQIDQIALEYESEPAKGLAHGVQKDAIQNAVGGRVSGSEPNSYKNWAFEFELLNLGGNHALSFMDQGTTGLTGDILCVEEIEQLSESEMLTAEQKLSRFLTRFESGGNLGPGSFGRGKLIFQAASKKYHIICDSLREDGKYIAFERKIIGKRLKQTPLPKQDNEAKTFISEISGGVLSPLTKTGTRITIVDLKDEIIDAFKQSFDPDNGEDYSNSFVKMIEETWWEIIKKFDAKIKVKWEDREKFVELIDPLKITADIQKDADGWRVYKLENERIVVRGDSYKIKELKFVISPQPIDQDLQDVWVQRKRMKIGNLRPLNTHNAIRKKLLGYIILNNDLEELIEASNAEGTTHYGFNYRKPVMRQIREFVNNRLDHFQESIGLKIPSEKATIREDMLEVMREINEIADDLGLATEFSAGRKQKGLSLTIKSFGLPNDDSLVIDYGDVVGPIKYKINNRKTKTQHLTFSVVAFQKTDGQLNETTLHTEDIDIEGKSSLSSIVDEFEITDEFENGELVIEGRLVKRDKKDIVCRNSKTLWVVEEPDVEDEPESFTVTTHMPLFPHAKSRRVDIEESILNIQFDVSNNTAKDVKVNADLYVRRAKYPDEKLQIITSERGFVLKAMNDEIFALDSLEIKSEIYGDLEETPKDYKERECEIYFSMRSAENVPELNLMKGEHIARKKINFYIGVDPPGDSIFKGTDEWEGPDDGQRSRRRGTRAEGYYFELNVKHPSYIFAKDAGKDVEQYYIKEQMLRQAYVIVINEGEFHGLAKDYSERLKQEDLTPSDIFLIIEELIGKSLIKVG